MTPLITIITATWNARKNIKQSLESVLSQTYPCIEYIVVDGGSTDGTQKILRDYGRKRFRKKNRIFIWKSEKDRGIADAFNKGINMARGDYIYFLGAGDVLKTPYVIEQMMEGVDSKKDMILAGRIDRIRDTKKYSVLYTSSLRFSSWMLLFKMGLPHQGMFMNRRFFQKFGVFDIHCRYGMDYELLLRAYRTFPHVILKDVIVAGWREGGVGTNKIFDILREYHWIRAKNNIAPLWLLYLIYIASAIRYIPEHVYNKIICGK